MCLRPMPLMVLGADGAVPSMLPVRINAIFYLSEKG